MNEKEKNRAYFLLDCLENNGQITLNREDMLNVLKLNREITIDECFKAMRKKVDEVFQRQTEERHEKDLSAYQQPFDCFSMGTIELEIFREAENQMKEQKHI